MGLGSWFFHIEIIETIVVYKESLDRYQWLMPVYLAT
jgi:hypothetical protein